MRLTAVSRAVGLPLARDLPAVGGRVPLLGRGATISERYVRALADHGIRSVWVEDELSAGIEPAELLPEAERADGEVRMRRLSEAARAGSAASRVLPSETLDDLATLVSDLTARASACTDTVVVLHDVAAADRFLHRHPVNRAALGTLLGAALFRRHGWVDSTGSRQFERVGRAARTARPRVAPRRHRHGRRTGRRAGPAGAAERRRTGAHPPPPRRRRRAAVRALDKPADRRRRGAPPRAPRRHGVPARMRGAEIHQFAAIAAVADVYAAATAERPYRPAHPSDAGVAIVRDGAGTAFDPEVVDVFRRVVVPHPPGTEVALPDGRVGIVAAVDPTVPYAPVVRVAEGGAVVERRVDTRAESSVR